MKKKTQKPESLGRGWFHCSVQELAHRHSSQVHSSGKGRTTDDPASGTSQLMAGECVT